MGRRSRKEFRSSHTTKEEEELSSYIVEDDIRKFAKIRLDAHGVDKENSIAGSNTVKKHGVGCEVPGDIYNDVQQALALMKHLETNKNDEDAKSDLRHVEAMIRMSTRYHKMNDNLPSDWKYNPATASTLVAKKCEPFQAKTKKIKEGPNGSSSDLEDYETSGMVRRKTKGGYDFHRPMGVDRALIF
ncbi:40S ribosomal protein S13 [Artemisia annua]|uniref:40S ribosomal protein S13 n=1 Tax=Artemisia annua TaxID=35608 RepID=A0A2U1KD01_ARTAN|nr:40S ribosomal protein S13 [Artemisia annua]